MTLNISPEKMAEYRAGARKREAESQAALDERFELAWQLARQGADILRRQFGATKVVVFGSLVNRQRFFERSDIDLAVWGIPEHLYLHALGRLLDLTTDFSVDLVRVEEAREHMSRSIETEGVEL
jgi:predicted nucleotidyltransferase